jgi:hypothetical protein
MTNLKIKGIGKTQISFKNVSRYHISHQLIITGKATESYFDYSTNSLSNGKKKI